MLRSPGDGRAERDSAASTAVLPHGQGTSAPGECLHFCEDRTWPGFQWG